MSQPLKTVDLERFPADLPAAFEAEIAARLKAERQARDLQRAADEHEEIIQRLEHLVKELRHALYAKKSEKLAPDDRQLCFEELEVAVAEAEEQQARTKDDAPRKKTTKSKRNLGNLPKELPRIENIVSATYSPSRFQLDAGLKAQGMRSSIWAAGWPAAMASRVALR